MQLADLWQYDEEFPGHSPCIPVTSSWEAVNDFQKHEESEALPGKLLISELQLFRKRG